MDFFVALDSSNYELVNDGTTARSNIIYIPPGNVALLSLYNMINVVTMEGAENKKELVNRSCITVKKLSFGPTGDIAEKGIDMCQQQINLSAEYKKLLANRRVFGEPVYQECCAWSINPGNNFAMIPTPGYYVLETKDLDQLDTAYVEYAILTAEQAKAIPDNFKLGS